ncbi:Na+/xyloside symporter related transporter [Secundilactobacillus pentosiphilus]|uniref:Na+/xyloside symporter related transporter n=1 Tax=Secundilactobacillus pentosiphilus TaxID=1714682 RepID=A0A1Z5ITC0_9LACO|nr:glycoside-pentoside-hexuronide (GPH):cation symporter [Secundilactobacillus pentosiphilus]GAX05017.1 Na+/xyloside symporter related transporter [Secundilactobacillus pentosiphilus]
MKKYISYALGAFGHDAFYNTLSIYFMMFVTSQLFTNAGDAKMVGFVTTLIVVIRVGEIMFDPIIGGVVDNTNTRWGKFKPWLLGGSLVASAGLIMIFSDYFGLTTSNPMLYLILFGITFVLLDGSYSFADISFWSMLPALSMKADERTKFGTFARFGSTLGAQGVIIIITPAIMLFSQIFSGAKSGQQTQAGWLGYAIVVAVLCVGGAMMTCLNTNEQHNKIRNNTKHTGVLEVFKVIARNDQLLWIALAYFLFAFSYVVNNSLLMYYFRYRLGNAGAYTWVGVITCILGVISVASFPALEALVHRKAIFCGGIGVMLLGYILFLFAGTNLLLALVAIGLLFFPYPLIFLATLMAITDSVEYGQLKSGHRNESVTLSVRPLIDKLSGAISNGVVGIVAVAAGMTGDAKPSDISASGVFHFNMFMFYIPMVLLVVSALLFFTKVQLSEKKHAQIVEKLETKLDDNGNTEASTVTTDVNTDANAVPDHS